MEFRDTDLLAQSVIVAIQAGDIGALQTRLGDNPGLAKAEVVDKDKNGRTLLHVATDWPGHFPNVAQTIALLIAEGADPNLPMLTMKPHRETPLHWAASSDDVEAIDALLDGGANIEVPGAIFTGGTAMSDAVIFACWNAANRLLERGAKTTFTQAAGLGLMDRLTPYFEQVTPPSHDELTAALWHASRGGRLQTVQYLVEKGADLNWIGWDRMTPLDGARQSGNATLVTWLRAAGAQTAAELGA